MADDNPQGEDNDAPAGPWRFFRSALGREPNPRPGTMLRDLFGRASRDRNRPDTARAAEGLGVSRRTVQRWVKEGKLPADRADELKAQWADSPQGRRRRIDPATRRMFVSGSPVACTVEANVTISNDRRNGKPRPFTVVFDPAQAQGLLGAMTNGDDAEAERIWADTVEGGFGGSVDLDIKSTRWQAGH